MVRRERERFRDWDLWGYMKGYERVARLQSHYG